MRKFQIAVIGYNDDRCSADARSLAYETGKEIAKAGAVLVCGGLGGVMEAACKGAKEAGGTTVGIIPQEEFSYANKYCDIVICSTIGFARDIIVAASADGMIVVGGGAGTLTELTIGYLMKKTMVAVAGSGGMAEMYGGQYLDERRRVQITIAKTPHEAVRIVAGKN